MPQHQGKDQQGKVQRRIVIIGIGTGNPEHMTMQAINALNRLDVILIPRKGEEKAGLAQLRHEICRLYLTNSQTRIVEFDLPVRDEDAPTYKQGVEDWHGEIAALYRDLFAHEAENAVIGLLVWGDPSLYDSTLRILDRVVESADFSFQREIIPGITSIQALAASHGIALNTLASPFTVTTGRRLREGFPQESDTAIVMLDGECSFQTLEASAYDIFWGAYLGMEGEIIAAGALDDEGEKIVAMRDEARARNGWIMDIYLLRRRHKGAQ